MKYFTVTFMSATSPVRDYEVIQANDRETALEIAMSRFGDRLLDFNEEDVEPTTPWYKSLFTTVTKVVSSIRKRYVEKKIGDVIDTVNSLLHHSFELNHTSLYAAQELMTHAMLDIKRNPEVYADVLSKIVLSGKRIINELNAVSKEVKTTINTNKDHFNQLGNELSLIFNEFQKRANVINEKSVTTATKIVDLFE